MRETRFMSILMTLFVLFSLTQGVGGSCDQLGHIHDYKIGEDLQCHSVKVTSTLPVLSIPYYELVLVQPEMSENLFDDSELDYQEPDVSQKKKPPRAA